MRAAGADLDRLADAVWREVSALPLEDRMAALRSLGSDLVKATTDRIAAAMRAAANVGSSTTEAALAQATGLAEIPGADVAERIAARLVARGGVGGLPLSQRVHRMTATFRANLDGVIAQGLRDGKGAFSIAERIREAGLAGRPPEPALVRQATSLVRRMGDGGGPEAWAEAQRLADDARRHAARLLGEQRLVGGGMRPAWEEFAKRLERAATTGNAEVLDKACRWWAHDKQQYHAKVIARTETMDAYATALEQRAKDSGLVEKLVWRVADDTACEDCLALDGQEFDPGGPHPHCPLHPNCRCGWEHKIDRNAALDEIVRRELAKT